MCVQCDGVEFELTSLGHCDCIQGHLVGQYCTDVYGCTSTEKINNITFCSYCNFSLHLSLDPITRQCLCLAGYQLQNGVCSDICGDGVLLEAECDDGNVENGDGCSSVCEVEPYHRCVFNSSSQMSSCQYAGREVTVTLIETQKSTERDQGVFTFEFAPPMPLLLKYDFAALFFFTAQDAEYEVVSWSYSGSQAVLRVDFTTDL